MVDEELIGIDVLQRPGQASQLLAVGDLPGAWDAMLRPTDLTPQERDALLKKWQVADGPWNAAYRMATNPLLLASLALSHVFPVASAKNMFKVSQEVGGLTARMPLLRGLASHHTIFRGTPIPNLIDEFIASKQVIGTKYLTRFGQIFDEFEALSGHTPTAREQTMISSWLSGLHKPLKGFEQANVGALLPELETHMGKPLLDLAHKVETALVDHRKELFSGLDAGRLKRALARHKGSGYFDDVDEIMSEWAGDPTTNLFPRRAVQTEEGFRNLMGALLNGKGTDPKAQSQVVRWLGKRQEARQYSMIPSLDDLGEVRDLVDDQAYGQMAETIKQQILKGAKGKVRPDMLEKMAGLPADEVLGNYTAHLQGPEAANFARAVADHIPHHYSLKLAPVLEQYVHNTSTTYAWHTTGIGDKMRKISKRAERLGATDARAAWRANYLNDTYIPIMLGRQPVRQTIRAQAWDQTLQRISLQLDKPIVKNALGEKMTSYLKTTFSRTKGSLSLRNMDQKLSGYFYLSTLGMNPGSAIKNMADFLKVGAVVGPKTAAEAMGRTIINGEKYFSARFTSGLSHDDALRAAFPDFVEAGVSGAPVTSEALGNAFQNAYNIAAIPSGKTVKVGEKISRAMMAMFSTTEYTNRLATFQAGMLHAGRAGLERKASLDFARQLTARTQFAGGPLAGPALLLDKPHLLAQMMRYPTQMLEFVTSTAVTLGSQEKNWLGYNPGTLARTIAGSVMAYELGDSLGINMGDALLGGSLPTFQESGRAFAPLPLVPPAVQLAGSVAMGIAKGDFADLARNTPLLVPGGVQIYRAMGLLPPSVPGSQMGQDAARWAERTYADYQQPAPDGRIAVFTGKNTLRGYYRPWELVAMGIGIKAGGPEQESQMLQMMTKQRDQIRDYRQQAMNALYLNDPATAMRIQNEFKQRYGFAMTIGQDDMKAMQAKRRVTRLEQVYRTLPPEARESFQPLMAAAFGQETAGVLGIDPSLLQAAPEQRELSRQGRGSRSVGPYTHQMGPLGSVDPAKVGRASYPGQSPLGG